MSEVEREAEFAALTMEIDALRARAAGAGADVLARLLGSAAAEASTFLTGGT
jgi:hypothetical protein